MTIVVGEEKKARNFGRSGRGGPAEGRSLWFKLKLPLVYIGVQMKTKPVRVHFGDSIPPLGPGGEEGKRGGEVGLKEGLKERFTVRPKTPSDLIPWAQKIEFESCK